MSAPQASDRSEPAAESGGRETEGPSQSRRSEQDPALPGAGELLAALEAPQEALRGFVRAHPTACLVGALALGFAVARLVRREDS